ncbi:MAG: histidine kinase, partial [Deltaproteobacteria bacterium]|nr:histidine kinase [Deltaproteobacteria bacterium]
NQLEQVFLNLISNARDALDDTEGAKQLTISSGLVEERGTQWVTVAVKDNGVGISPENLDRVFEPFFSTKPVGRGTGLGLSLCYGIIEAHKGRIEINSYQGQGTEVRILLPARDSGKG